MSEFRDALRDVVADREAGTAELCRNLTTNRTFTAEIEAIEDVELNTELGRDARERLLMHVLRGDVAAEILPQQRLAVTLYGEVITCRVLRRKDNPSDPQVEFGLMKLTEKDS